MSKSKPADFAVLGMGVMGQNLALNLADHGSRVAVWNRSPEPQRAFVAAAARPDVLGFDALPSLVASLERPRRLLLLVKAGPPVDETLDALAPLLDEGDIVIDGGNTWFQDTRRREELCRALGLRFFGMGVSGGEEGARHGPSLMPGGDRASYERMLPQLEAIAAHTEHGACVAWCGPDGAGHFVKMVHNGIEYADMQLIAEVYDWMRKGLHLSAVAAADVFSRWDEGPLASFLTEITAKVLRAPDEETGQSRVDIVLDEAGQKGTGKWTAQVALDLGVPVPAIAAAVDARTLSGGRAARQARAQAWPRPMSGPGADLEAGLADLHDALLTAKIGAYAQGMRLIQAASDTHGWGTDLAEMARIWTGGCIIRARLLPEIMAAFRRAPNLPDLLEDPALAEAFGRGLPALRRVVGRAVAGGVAAPAMSATLAWFDARTSAELPQNLTQAQRDCFGAHTYVRRDDPARGPIHSEW